MTELVLRLPGPGSREANPRDPIDARRAPVAPESPSPDAGGFVDASAPHDVVDATESELGPVDPEVIRRRRRRGQRWAAAESLALVTALAVTGATLASSYETSLRSGAVFDGVRVGGHDVGGLGREDLAELAADIAVESTQRPTRLVAGELSVETTPAELGATAAPEGALEAAMLVGRSGDLVLDLMQRAAARRGEVDVPVGLRFREEPALEQLLAIAPEVETPSLPTRLDLEGRQVLPARRGTALLPYDSLSNVAIGLAAGDEAISLVVQDKPAVLDDPLGELADVLDVGVALGRFSTSYHNDAQHAARSHNLKLGAAAIDGYVLMPGETFSFNEVVGLRSAENGYRYAPGITAGELVDVLGGGICQVASSMFGAAFFGGLEVVAARPHSRPSSYVDMGLDATVVDDMIDLKFKNPYDFPVVLHMSVNDGTVEAEVLGPRRPYQITFSRHLEEVVPYETITRDDDRYRLGTEKVAQRGMRGFTVTRERKFLQGGDVVKTESWRLHYPPTTKIVHRGTSPSGEVPEARKLPPLRDPRDDLEITQ